MTHNQSRDIAIIGGGIGGLTAALAFARQDANVTVYEQAPALTEVGAGLQITPNGARALNALGIDNDLNATGVTAQAVVPMDAVRSREITRFDLSTQNPPYRFYHRAALIDILARGCEAAGVKFKLGARISGLNPDGSFDIGDAVVRPDLTIGADGLHSVVRGVINKPTEPFFTGQVAWRAMIKTDKSDPVARIWMAPGRHMVTYPLSGGRLNIVAVQERSGWAAEGWNHADDPGNLRMAFADCGWEVKSILGEVETANLWGLFRHPVAEKWHSGSVAILGDAAHPTLPFLAQGANLAIEDAYTLARCCNADASLAAALQTYQDTRRARVIKAVEAANKNARNYHLSGVQRRIAHAGLKTMGKVAPAAFLNRLSWLYDHDVTR
ncbi:FAD-dependent monooxygenase [Roseobacter sp. CCS2]|uniref:FAD-dependent monooxygenase n=1 Tax=Roseobacter sp. CCS2 TaxID=391593 RepID=UPI0000F40675|nr:FAD-dependent monooxygenase [Roseobacter sp. CCS2]EBA11308.1 monooxygenase, FAD-binding protein [Roseobacter sp. CCS2]